MIYSSAALLVCDTVLGAEIKALYSPTSIIQTQGATKMQDQDTNCDYVTGLLMRSKPT
jgi:hypothetical protein